MDKDNGRTAAAYLKSWVIFASSRGDGALAGGAEPAGRTGGKSSPSGRSRRNVRKRRAKYGPSALTKETVARMKKEGSKVKE